MAEPLEKHLAVESQRFDEAAERLGNHRGKDDNVVAMVELLGVQLHHVERIQERLHAANFGIAKELNQLLGKLQGKQQSIRATYKEAKKKAPGKKLYKGTGSEMHETQTMLRAIDGHIGQLKKVRENLLRHTKRHTSTVALLAREAGQKKEM
jgi:hypothetical protein